MQILVTGAAGFIGYFTTQALCARGDTVIGIDNLNSYYDVSLKEARVTKLKEHDNLEFHAMDLADKGALNQLFDSHSIDIVVNLAAQAGVRYSLESPETYIQSNIVGFLNILENCRHHDIKHLVYASSSSVYGANTNYPFSEHDTVDHPVSLYAASKKSNEVMAHTYAHLFNLPCTGLRFFTVYGPWGRPDMAYFKFVQKILNKEPIDVYNNGDMYRDFTYIDDIVTGIINAVDRPAKPNSNWSGDKPDPATSYAPWQLFNLGHGHPIKLMDFIHTVEACLNRSATINFLPMQPGDVKKTAADITRLKSSLDYAPTVDTQTGIKHFVDWYLDYTQHNGPIQLT